MADEERQEALSDEELKEAVEELSAEPEAEAPQPKAKPTGLHKELAKLETRRREMKAKGATIEDGEWAKVKTRIAEIKAELGIQ